MRRLFWAGLVGAVGIGGCGGGGNDGTVQSAETFPVRASYDNLASKGLSVPISGKDNVEPATGDPTAFETVGAGTAFQSTRPVPDWNNWFGTMRVSLRNGAPENTPSCAAATRQVDILITLERKRDRYRTQDGITIGYTTEYKPVCAFRLDGTYWEWNRAAGLPVAAKIGNLDGVQFTGTLVRLPNQNAVLQADPSVSGSQETPDDTESSLTSWTTLDAATVDSALLNFGYKTTRIAAQPPVDNQTTLKGVSTEIGFRIRPDGALLGVRYKRDGPLTNDIENVVTLSLSSE
jgi:hypothetical protein